jgi:hypothetical protein
MEALPPLSSDIVFPRAGNYQKWWHWPARGGPPEEMAKLPSHLSDDCAPVWTGGFGDACYSPAGRFKLVDVPAQIEGGYVGILDGLSNTRITMPDSFTYTEGYNTFAWSEDEKFLAFARGDNIARLTKVDPVTGESQTVWDSSLCGLNIWDCASYSLVAITDPIVFEDGSLGFAFQSSHPQLYPPPGIYRLSSEGELTRLVSLPLIDESKGLGPDTSAPVYGYLLWSPDKSMFLFYDKFIGNKTGMRTLLLGKTDGSALWDLREVFPSEYEFRWQQ